MKEEMECEIREATERIQKHQIEKSEGRKELIISKRVYKAGYEIRTEDIWDFGCKKPIRMKSAYAPNGDYIGDPKTAYRLCVKRGIHPELAQESNNVCSIGFSEREQKWYGWSHRAICGFSTGSKVECGDCGYVPSNVNELAKEYREWNNNVKIVDATTIRICQKFVKAVGENEDGSLILQPCEKEECYEVETGRGEWKASTLEDAKQMAIDFAKGVS